VKKWTLQYKSFALGADKAPYPVDYLANHFSSAFIAAKKERSKRTGQPFNACVPDHHEIVSKTEFSTREFILEDEYMGNNLIWPRNLGQAFRGGMAYKCKDAVDLQGSRLTCPEFPQSSPPSRACLETLWSHQ
jgi:hypothetical protein